MGTITCNGQPAFPSTWLISEGYPFNIYSAWANSYASDTFNLRYYASSSSSAIDDIETCTIITSFLTKLLKAYFTLTLLSHLLLLLSFSADSIDFGTITTPLAQEDYKKIPDVGQIPIITYAIGPAYNVSSSWLTNRSFIDVSIALQVPSIAEKATLVLNLTTLADILLGNVDNWNHSAIRALNPDLLPHLPNATITVVLPVGVTGEDIVTLILTEALSAVSTPFRKAVLQPLQPSI